MYTVFGFCIKSIGINFKYAKYLINTFKGLLISVGAVSVRAQIQEKCVFIAVSHFISFLFSSSPCYGIVLLFFKARK